MTSHGKFLYVMVRWGIFRSADGSMEITGSLDFQKIFKVKSLIHGAIYFIAHAYIK